MVAEAIRRQAGLNHFILDSDGDAIVIYLPDRGEADADELVGLLAGPLGRSQEKREWLIQQSNFSKTMRIVLADAHERTFSVQRWCFLGSIDNWMHVARPAKLAEQLKKYLKHLGKESFYELI